MPTVSTVDLTADLTARIAFRIDEHEAEIKRLKQLQVLLGSIPKDLPASSTVTSTVETPVAEVTDATLLSHLTLLTRRVGVVTLAEAPYLLKAQFSTEFAEADIPSLMSRVTSTFQNNGNIFERVGRGKYQLTPANKRRGNGLNSRPLIEHAYDALSSFPDRTGSLRQIADFARDKGYKSQATTPLQTLVGQLLTDDGRFIRVRRGVYRLRANS